MFRLLGDPRNIRINAQIKNVSARLVNTMSAIFAGIPGFVAGRHFKNQHMSERNITTKLAVYFFIFRTFYLTNNVQICTSFK